MEKSGFEKPDVAKWTACIENINPEESKEGVEGLETSSGYCWECNTASPQAKSSVEDLSFRGLRLK